MSDVLSQSEIDALLNAVGGDASPDEGGGAPPAPPETPAPSGESDESGPDWIAYDLATQEKLVRGRLGALEGIHERFARLFRMTLSNNLKKTISVSYTSTDYLRFSEYLTTILLPTSLNIFQVRAPVGSMIFVIGSKLTYALVDSYYGGSERPYSKVGGREEFTAIESRMIRKVSGLAAKDLMTAWHLNYPLELDFVRTESNPHFIGSIHGSETVAVVSFDVEMENLSGPFVIILQVKSLEPIRQALNANVMGETPVDKAAWRQHWLRELSNVYMNVSVPLGRTPGDIHSIRHMKVGDVLKLDRKTTQPLSVMVEGIPKFTGMMGVCRGSSAVRITKKVPVKTRSQKDE